MNNQLQLKIFITIIITGSFLLTIFPSHVTSLQNFDVKFQKPIVSQINAFYAAENFLQKLKKSNEFDIESYEKIFDKINSKHLGYIFHLSPQGYIIISPSLNITPVIAYSFTSNATMSLIPNPLYSLLSVDINAQLIKIDTIPPEEKIVHRNEWKVILDCQKNTFMTNAFQQWPPEGSTRTEGWIETLWHQESPFNNFCPIDPDSGQRSVAGCPAITMAQILNYHQTTNLIRLNDSDDYFHNYINNFWIDNDHEEYDFPSFSVLNTYLSTLENHYQSNIKLTDNDKATLSFTCGIAAKQVYSPLVSGTFGINQGYDAYQRFNCKNASLYYKPDNIIFDKIIENVKHALPVHFAIVTPEWDAGHNLIIDGYNTNDYYHLNFGWGGQYNGWYQIPDYLPYELTIIEGVILDILNKTTTEDLSVNGSLLWQEKSGGEVIEDSFSIQNRGKQNSSLSWKVLSIPDWGEWTIIPSEGQNIKPEDGEIIIQVICNLPNEKRKQYDNSITIINTNNPSDRDYIPISLSLSKQKQINPSIKQIIFHNLIFIQNILNFSFDSYHISP